MGAGRKETDNSFTGLVMGEVKEGGSSTSEVGLFGYNKGQRSIFLDAETGTAAFGVEGKGQVIIDPTEDRALLRSGNYRQGYSGMAIDLTTPQITYGNGNFTVDNEGHLYASEGELGAGSSKIHLGGQGSRSYVYSGNKNTLTSTSTGFYLGTDGFAMGAGSSGQSAFQIDTTGAVKATNISVQNAATSNGRIEITAGSSWSQINFYYGGNRRGYIYGGSNGLEIWGSPTYIGGSSMDISASTLDISSSTMYIRANTLYAQTSSGTPARAINGVYNVLSKETHNSFGFMQKHYYIMTFYNGILVESGTGEESDS